MNRVLFFQFFHIENLANFPKNLAKLVAFKLEKRKFLNIFPICLPKKNIGPLSLSLAFVDANECEQWELCSHEVNFVSLDFRLVWRLLQWQRDPVFAGVLVFSSSCLLVSFFFFSSLQLDYVVAFLLKILPCQPEVWKNYFRILFSGFRLPLSLSLFHQPLISFPSLSCCSMFLFVPEED